MKKYLLLLLAASVQSSLLGVYAPIPEVEKDQMFTITVEAGGHHDSNVLGSPSNEIESWVWTLSPSITYNASLSDVTLLSAWYKLDAFEYEDRGDGGTDDSLQNHTLGAELNHTFTETLFLAIKDEYRDIDSPASNLTGLGVAQTDQSYKFNHFGATLNARSSDTSNFVLKYRNLDYNYDTTALSNLLDRNEHLFGFAYEHSLSDETTLVGELRYQEVSYDSNTGIDRDSTSNFYLVGVDWSASDELEFSARVGLEDRDRDGGSDDSGGYAQITAVYNYADRSFLSVGFTYDTQETSDTTTFLDEEVYAVFLNIQHAFTDAITGSASIYYDEAELQGRAAGTDADDETFRFGLGLTWIPAERWAILFNYDYDDTSSDVAAREEERHRVGITARYTFGLGN